KLGDKLVKESGLFRKTPRSIDLCSVVEETRARRYQRCSHSVPSAAVRGDFFHLAWCELDPPLPTPIRSSRRCFLLLYDQYLAKTTFFG
ncbi:hypothetical protein STEG23_036281, partial [Scotinomys teguina]